MIIIQKIKKSKWDTNNSTLYYKCKNNVQNIIDVHGFGSQAYLYLLQTDNYL